MNRRSQEYLGYAQEFELKKQKFNKIMEGHIQLIQDYV